MKMETAQYFSVVSLFRTFSVFNVKIIDLGFIFYAEFRSHHNFSLSLSIWLLVRLYRDTI